MAWIAAPVVVRGVDGDALLWRADWGTAIDVDTEPFPLTAICGLLQTPGDASPGSAGFGLAGWQRPEAALPPRAEEGS